MGLDPAKKKGILDAIAAIKDSRVRPFEIDQETADDFKNKGLRLPKNTKIKEGTSEEDPKDKAARIERIKKELSGDSAQELLGQIETEAEMKKLAELDKQAEAERARQIANQVREPASFENFADDLLRAVQQQTEEEEGEVSGQTYYRPNPLKDLTGLAHPGEYYPDVPSKPLIVMYIDQSGSWSESDIKRGKQAVRSIVGYQETDQIDLVFRYFANDVYNSPEQAR